jgi:hypothetical protein
MAAKVKIIIGAAIAVLLLALGTGFFIGRKQIKAKDHIISLLVNQNQEYESTITKSNAHISTQDQFITSLKLAQQALLFNIDSLKERGIKNVGAIVKLNTEIKRLKLEAQFTTPPVIVNDTTVDDASITLGEEKVYLRVPISWKFQDKWLDVNGTVKYTGVTIDKLVSYSQPSITLGYSREFLKKSKPIVVFEDKNPYTLVTNMSNVVIINKPPVYNRPWFHMLEGAAIVVAGAWGVNQIK